jgi:hypothetical protein
MATGSIWKFGSNAFEMSELGPELRWLDFP